MRTYPTFQHRQRYCLVCDMPTRQNIRICASQADWERIRSEVQNSFIVKGIELNAIYKCMDCESLLASVEPYMDRFIPTTTDGQIKFPDDKEEENDEEEIKFSNIEADPAT